MKVLVRAEGSKVLIAVNDRVFLEIGYREGKELVRAVHIAALKAEEYAQAERLVYEGAILARAGLPFTLSDDPRIKDEVRKEAAWNSDLRRYMPGGVKAKEVVGTPTVINHGENHG